MQFKNINLLRIIFTIMLACTIGFTACEKSEDTVSEESTLESDKFQETQVDSFIQDETAAVDYGQIMNQLFELENTIKTQPQDINARIAFLSVAIDSGRQKIYTVGEGLPDTTATSPALAQQAAERAALVDAQRWALFALAWQKDPKTPAITDKVSGKVPPFKKIQKAEMPDKQVYLLIEIAN